MTLKIDKTVKVIIVTRFCKQVQIAHCNYMSAVATEY